MSDAPEALPEGDRTITVVAMPADTNPSGDIFGGWILSQMDIAGGVAASIGRDVLEDGVSGNHAANQGS